MAKQTLEEILLARREDPRAMRGALTIVKGVPHITFGVVGEHRRFSLAVKGDDFDLVADPRPEPEDEPEAEGEGLDDEAAQLAAAKAEAEALGIKFGANIGLKTLLGKIEEAKTAPEGGAE